MDWPDAKIFPSLQGEFHDPAKRDEGASSWF
jgi:hypothetical protein